MTIAQRTAYILFCALLAWAGPARALTVKLGSLAPAGTPWDKHLKRISAEWSTLSGGRVVLKIYPGGITGDEPDMLRKIRLGQLQAAGITAPSLWAVAPGLLAMHLPLLIRSDAELEYVLGKMQAGLERDLEARGFTVLVWSTVGWTHFFSKEPVIIPADLKKQKMFVWQGDANEVQSWKEIGFNPVPLAATDIMTSLQNGMVDVIPTTPLMAASNQYFGVAGRMCDMKWSPLLGAIVISTQTWNKIAPDLRTQLLQAARRIGADMQKEIDATEQQAVEVMKQHGLQITAITPEQEKEWQAVVTAGFTTFLGKGYDKTYYETVKKHLDDFRAGRTD